MQMSLYEKYLSLAGFGTDAAPRANRGARLFADYQALMRIWTHPWVMKMDEIRQADKVWNRNLASSVILILIICRYLFTLTYTKCACKCINFILEKKKGRKWYREGLFSFDWSWIILCSLLVLHLQFCLYVLFDCMSYTFYFLYQIIVQIHDNFSCTEHAVQQWFMYWMFNKG